MLGARECLREIRDPCERGDLKPGAYARLEYGELVEVSVTGLDEEFFQGRGLVSSCRLSRGWHGGGGGRVGCDGSGIGHEGRLENHLYNGVDVHSSC